MENLVLIKENKALTTSLLVAEKFGKEHKNVLRDIRSIIEGGLNFEHTPMFVESTYINEQNNEEYPMFIMNRDGFTLLAMGFNGKKAMQFKIEYIQAFNSMEKTINRQPKQLSGAEFLLQQAQLMVEQERRLSNIEQEISTMKQERENNSKMLLAVSVSSELLPELSMRDKIRKLVNTYSSANNISQRDVWHKIYDQLYYLYHISIKAYKKSKSESLIDVAEKNNLLDKMYTIISNMVRELK